MIFKDFTSKNLLIFEICAREICEEFDHKHSETIEYVKTSLLFKTFTTFIGNNSRIIRIKNAKFSGYCFYL